jgi:transmembrane sensor
MGSRPPSPSRTPPLPDGFEAIARTPDLDLAGGGRAAVIAVRRGRCTLRVRGWGTVTLATGASLRRATDGLELLLGEATFQVDERAPAAGSTFVRGPQGTIEITGTRFSVSQRPEGGSVHLHEGAIRFHAPDGRTVTLSPGESLSWPLAASPAPSPLGPRRASAASESPSPSPPPPGRPGPAPAASRARSSPGREDRRPVKDDIVERIAALRAAGEYRALADELRGAVAREPGQATRERLSFELGSILSHHLPDRARACAHWEAHRRAFPNGRYEQELSELENALDCRTKGEDQ